MFPLRQIVSNARRVVPGFRAMASSGPLVDTAVDNDGIAIVTMQRPPVNSLNLELLQAMSTALDEVAKNKCKGMILTSASPTVFSAGLDIMEMYKPDMKRVEIFWTTLQEVWIKLFGSNFITAAAINGHAPAGGCLISVSCEYRVMMSGKYSIGLKETAVGIFAPSWVMQTMVNTIPRRQAELALTSAEMFSVEEALQNILAEVSASSACLRGMVLNTVCISQLGAKISTAVSFNAMLYLPLIMTRYSQGHAPAGGCLISMSCEYRVMMSGKYSIGLNETALGIVAPSWFMQTMVNTIPQRQAELALTSAKMFSVEEALQVGLIDETATDKADAVAKCKQFIKKFDRIPALARSLTKQKIREAPLAWMEENRKRDTQEFLMFVGHPKVQKSLEMYIQALKEKAAK